MGMSYRQQYISDLLAILAYVFVIRNYVYEIKL